MFNPIANALFLASRMEKPRKTHESMLYQHEQRKRDELNRQKALAYFFANSSRRG